MRVTKVAMATLLAAGMSLGMMACSSEGSDEISGQEETAAAESSAEVEVEDEDDDAEDAPDPPTEITGFNEIAAHLKEYHQIPDDYLQGMLDGSVKSERQFLGYGMGPTYSYDSNDLVMWITPDGEVVELGPRNSALTHGDAFAPRGFDEYKPFEFTR